MIRPQKVPIRPTNNQLPSNEQIQSSTNVTDITSYIGKILTLNYHQVIVEDILGQGGFAFVFLVRSFNQQRYALKRMYVNNRRDLNVCQREIAIVKEFSSHPNIVKYVDSYVQRLSPTNTCLHNYYSVRNSIDDNDDDAIYEILLLTEYCSNGSLVNRLHEQRNVGIMLNERQILRIFADICLAVSAFHFRRPQPILHRDIKLENILIDSHNNYVLCDFGSAIMLPSSSTNDYQQYQISELTTNVLQQIEEEIQRYTTQSYRAPEMIDLYSRLPLTLKIDIWAMGCLLYKLMYNTMPFGDSILAIQNGTFIIPDDMAQGYSRELNLLVRYMLEIDISKRPDIWQVTYITYKLLGMECPISNRCQSKVPNLNSVPMPLTDSESRSQRTAAKTKVPTKTSTDEFQSVGTAVNPRERPRGMIAPSTSLINFNQVSQLVPAVTNNPSITISNSTRSESASQLMFDDDFSQLSSHAISLNNLSTTITTNEKLASRARPSPSSTVSTSTGVTQQQQFLPPPLLPPPMIPTPSNVHTHRRSASQTLSPTNNQSPFLSASSVDSSSNDEASSYDDVVQMQTNIDKFQFNNYTKLDFQSDSDDDHIQSLQHGNMQKYSPKVKSTNHHPSTEEADKNKFSINIKNTNLSESSIQSNSNSTTHKVFDQGPEKHANIEQITRNSTLQSSFETSQSNSSSIDCNNPFLSAPFHLPASHKQTSASAANLDRKTTITMISPSTTDLHSILTGKRTSAFTPYQKRDSTIENHITDIQYSADSLTDKVSHQETVVSDHQPIANDVFTKAPFKMKSKTKHCSTLNNNTLFQPLSSHIVDNQIDENPNKTRNGIFDDMSPLPHGYSNLSFNANTIDEYF